MIRLPEKKLRVATRKSPLAMRQTLATVEHLTEAISGLEHELLPMSTSGDQRQSWSLEERGGKGLFTKELEVAMLDGRADLAVHSAKDMPTELPDGLSLAGYLPRVDPADVLVVRRGVDSPKTIATGSPRRRAQAKQLFPDAEFFEIRGSVETRLRKIAQGQADATYLAAAGLSRLGIEEFEGLVFRPMSLAEMIPAAGQAAIALECREEDVPVLAPFLCRETAKCVNLERQLLAALGGGCHTAVAIHVTDQRVYIFKEELGRKEYPIEATFTSEQVESLARTLC